MVKKTLILILVLSIQNLFSQVTFVVNELPESTPDNSSIYISGDFEGWSGGLEEYKLSKNKNAFFITLHEQTGSINFKFTRGSWKSVETDSTGKSIENRNYVFNKKNDTVSVKINGWKNTSSKLSTATENVSLLSGNFFMPQLKRERKIWIYLPPDYETTNHNYPVIYMHDGQNLFDEITSFSGEWEVDETLNKIYKDKKIGFIVIGIENAGAKRLDEYSPWENSKYGGGEGNAYLEFIVQTLKPFIDKNYRTYSDFEHTAIIGSSMGGLISYYAALKYPTVFSKIGVFSPSFWFSKKSLLYTKETGNLKNTKMYFLAGDKEGDNVTFDEINQTVIDINKIVDILKEEGFSQDHISLKIVPNGKHNEKLWRENFEEAILWLFNKQIN